MPLDYALLWFSLLSAFGVLIIWAARFAGPGLTGALLFVFGSISVLLGFGVLSTSTYERAPAFTLWIAASLLVVAFQMRAIFESVGAWFANSLGNHYRRDNWISIGELSGVVSQLGLLTTTIESEGGNSVRFPNSETLRKPLLNHSRSRGQWYELTVGVTHETDLNYCATVFLETAKRALKELPGRSAYAGHEPQLYFMRTDSIVQIVIRVPTTFRERELRRSTVISALQQEIEKPEHQGKIILGYPRVQVGLSVAQETSDEVPLMEE